MKKLVEVRVLVTPAEYERLRSERAMTGEGTVRAALRQALGWPEKPVGLGVAHEVLDEAGYEATR